LTGCRGWRRERRLWEERLNDRSGGPKALIARPVTTRAAAGNFQNRSGPKRTGADEKRPTMATRSAKGVTVAVEYRGNSEIQRVKPTLVLTKMI